MAINFQQSTQHPQLYLSSSDAAVRIGAWLPTGKAATYTLADLWQQPEACLFCLHTPITDHQHADFAVALGVWLQAPSRVNVRIVWFEKAVVPMTGLSAWFMLGVSAGNTDRLTVIPYDSMSIVLSKNVPVRLNESQDGFIIEQPTAGRFAMLRDADRYHTIDGNATLMMHGEQAGLVDVSFSLDPHIFEVELRYFFRDYSVEPLGRVFLVDHAAYPVFADTLYNLHLLRNSLSMRRPHFEFQSSERVPSFYRTIHGHTIYLMPQAGTRLIHTDSITASIPNTDDGVYLVPHGTYKMIVEHEDAAGNPVYEIEPDDRLLCGFSGVEYVDLQHDMALVFEAGKAAYARSFTGTAAALPSSVNDALTELGTTAWVYYTVGDGMPIYYAQPELAAYYAADTTEENPDDGSAMLLFREVPATELPAEGLRYFPSVPYAGVDQLQTGLFRLLEAQVLNPIRRDIIKQISEGLDNPPNPGTGYADTDVLTATEQGLLARFDQHMQTIKELAIARDVRTLNGKSWEQQIPLRGIQQRSKLRAAIQSNQLFLVIDDYEVFKEYFYTQADSPLDDETQLFIQGWGFDLNPESWHKHNTILIFKFFDKSLMEMAQNIGMWSQPDEFCDRPGRTQGRLLKLFNIALDRSPAVMTEDTDPEAFVNYRKLASIIEDPAWSGILALNVPVPPENLPPQLSGLAAGMDLDQFYAQYVGVDVTPIEVGEEILTNGKTRDVVVTKPSSLFGLIDYENTAITQDNGEPYDFRVLFLKVRYGNSEIQSFSCQIGVKLDQLLGELTLLEDAPFDTNEVQLRGRYEEHNGQGKYTFNFAGNNRFLTPQSGVFTDIQIMRASFATSPSADPAGFVPGETVRSRFVFSGRLNFALHDFDMLSFGSQAADDTPDGHHMAFSNMGVTMEFDWVDTEQEGAAFSPSFDFVPESMALNLAQSLARDNSLYAKFPLKLTGFVMSTKNGNVDSLGFMPVNTPIGGDKPTGDEWYGLTYDIELGTLGALSGGNPLVVSLLAAWQPDTDGYYVGLRMPGSSGGKKEISIQGVIKLTFERIVFTVGYDESDNAHYVLKLRNIMLKFLLLSLPPSGRTEITIFGDPQGTPQNTTLGWYAAYARNR